MLIGKDVIHFKKRSIVFSSIAAATINTSGVLRCVCVVYFYNAKGERLQGAQNQIEIARIVFPFVPVPGLCTSLGIFEMPGCFSNQLVDSVNEPACFFTEYNTSKPLCYVE